MFLCIALPLSVEIYLGNWWWPSTSCDSWGERSVWLLKMQCFIFIRFIFMFCFGILWHYSVWRRKDLCGCRGAGRPPVWYNSLRLADFSKHHHPSNYLPTLWQPPDRQPDTFTQSSLLNEIWNLNLILSVCWKIHFVLTRRPNWMFCSAWGMGWVGWECRGGGRGLGGRSWKKNCSW